MLQGKSEKHKKFPALNHHDEQLQLFRRRVWNLYRGMIHRGKVIKLPGG
jgi:hypothetical protein